MYTFDSRVRYSEIDHSGKISITSIINYLQDCSTLQSEDIGKGISYLEKIERAWWLCSWQIMIDRYPKLGESITVGTWAYGYKGMYGYRNFVIQDQAGDYVVRADSTWFYFDLIKGKPVRVGADDMEGYGIGKEKPLKMDYVKRKIGFKDNGENSCADIIVDNHHIDTNHHVNNAQYVEMAKNLIPNDFAIGEVRVEYKKAAVKGDIIVPYLENREDGYTVYLCDKQREPYAIVWMRRKD